MLPKNRRISRADFKKLEGERQRGRAYHSPLLSLFLYQKLSNTPSQFAFSVSKKVSKKAVVRNKLRRRGYASVQSVIQNIKPGYAVVFSFKKEAAEKDFQTTKAEIVGLLNKAGILLS